jgi:5-methyltetrahydrofolate--homocysteine methyltransferase
MATEKHPRGGSAVSLAYKPDFEQVKRVWNAYWEGEVLGRPPVWAVATRPGMPQGDLYRRYWHAVGGNFNYILDQVDMWLEGNEFLAESVPMFGPDFGPDQFAAFLGSDFEFSDESPDTDWVHQTIDDWKTALPLRHDPANRYWKGILGYSSMLAAHADSRYLVSVADLHSNMDTLLALRGSERLCLDFSDAPADVETAMKQVRAMYQPIYNALFAAGGMGGGRGSCGWAPFWCDGMFATIQCDFLALLSPALSRRYVIPALEEEASFLDRCVYHLDGPGCLPHLDDILAIKDIDVIQWVPGAGKPPMHEWMDVLKRCQAAGKGLQMYDIRDLDTVKKIARELHPEKLMYVLDVSTRDEVFHITDWLERNT